MSRSNARPGSAGEHYLQEKLGSANRARGFYDHQMLDRLNAHMQEFIGRMEMAFIATADGNGDCDCSFRAGEPGFMHVVDEKTVMFPDYRGNGVMASMGNIVENGHIGILFVDFLRDTVGLHVNGRARIVETVDVLTWDAPPPEAIDNLREPGSRRLHRWIVVDVEEAYIHCSKHIPLMVKADKSIFWGTDDVVRKGGDYFQAKHTDRPWAPAPTPAPAPKMPVYDAAGPEAPGLGTPSEDHYTPAHDVPGQDGPGHDVRGHAATAEPVTADHNAA